MKGFLLSGLFIFLLISCGKKTNVEITGEIKEGAKTKVYLERVDVGTKKVIDSTTLNRKGVFSFKLDMNVPMFYTLRFSNNEQITLLVKPNDRLAVSGTLRDLQNNYWVDGSEDANRIKLLTSQLNRTNTLTDSIRKAYQALPQEAIYDEKRAEYTKAWEEQVNKQIRFTRDFILKHGTSLVAYYALYQKINDNLFVMDEIEDLHYFKVVASALSAFYPDSPYTKAIMNHLKQIEKTIRNQRLISIINNAETSLPNICLPNVNGDTVCLNSLKNKLVILEFGVITPAQSQAYIDDLKRVYNKFKSRGVEIYQVCLDKNKLYWEEVVKRNDIDWICVWDKQALQSRVAGVSNVKSVPANYIINQRDEIVGKNLMGSRLEERLNDLLKK